MQIFRATVWEGHLGQRSCHDINILWIPICRGVQRLVNKRSIELRMEAKITKLIDGIPVLQGKIGGGRRKRQRVVSQIHV